MSDSKDNFLTRSPDFRAVLKYRTAKEGGRKTPAYSGYRPHVKFSGKSELTSGQQKFINRDKINPWETVEAEITLLWTGPFKSYLHESLEFGFYEGSVLIGTGIILQVLDKSLEKKFNTEL